jgi:hypothetical protein
MSTDERLEYCLCLCQSNYEPCCNYHYYYYYYFLWLCSPARATAFSYHEVSWSHTTTRHSGRVISSSQRPLPGNTRNTQQKNFHEPGGIRAHDRSRRATVVLRLRTRGHWDRLPAAVSYPRYAVSRVNFAVRRWKKNTFQLLKFLF